MVRSRPPLQPFTADGPILIAILEALDGLHDLLAERLRPLELKQPVKVTEPAPDTAPPAAVPVSEPAPDSAPEKAVPVAEPDPDDEPDVDEGLPEPPPRAGRGSGLEAWQAWASDAQVSYPEDARRDDIIAACIEAGVLPAE